MALAWRIIPAVLAAVLAPSVGTASDIWEREPLVSAAYAEPTTRYAHGILGDAIEHGALILVYGASHKKITIRLPQERVFEDTEPRLFDVDGDGQSEAIVVESHKDKGARLAIYNSSGLIAATPYIGRSNRWLAPIGAADMDGDGHVEIAYIDRPHLAKILRIWRFQGGELVEVASMPGLTNHRIGERDIGGGIRICAGQPEMVVASGDWRRVIVVGFVAGSLVATDVGKHTGRDSLNTALVCK